MPAVINMKENTCTKDGKKAYIHPTLIDEIDLIRRSINQIDQYPGEQDHCSAYDLRGI